MSVARRVVTRRDFIAWGIASIATLAWPRQVASASTELSIRLGVVLPSRMSSQAQFALTDNVAEGARQGAVFGVDECASEAFALGLDYKAFLANAPTVESAERAARRLVEVEGVAAIVGGVGSGQAELLSSIAEEYGVLFFNVGSQRDDLRGGECSRHAFHVEASEAMYLDAVADFGAQQGIRRWMVVGYDSAEGARLVSRARRAVEKASGGGDGDVVSNLVNPETIVFRNVIASVRDANVDAVLLMLDSVGQEFFLSEADRLGLSVPIAPLADPVSQTRRYYASVRDGAPTVATQPRIVLWDGTLAANGADRLNTRYLSRWGEPMAPSAWAAYAAAKALFLSVRDTGSTEADDLIRYLESEDTVFDVGKGPGTSFRSWDHQLRQRLYAVEIDTTGPYGVSASRQLALANVVDELPRMAIAEEEAEVGLLDRYGDLADRLTCTW